MIRGYDISSSTSKTIGIDISWLSTRKIMKVNKNTHTDSHSFYKIPLKFKKYFYSHSSYHGLKWNWRRQLDIYQTWTKHTKYIQKYFKYIPIRYNIFIITEEQQHKQTNVFTNLSEDLRAKFRLQNNCLPWLMWPPKMLPKNFYIFFDCQISTLPFQKLHILYKSCWGNAFLKVPKDQLIN